MSDHSKAHPALFLLVGDIINVLSDEDDKSASKFIQENFQLTVSIIQKSFQQMNNGTQAQTFPCDCRPLRDHIDALNERLKHCTPSSHKGGYASETTLNSSRLHSSTCTTPSRHQSLITNSDPFDAPEILCQTFQKTASKRSRSDSLTTSKGEDKGEDKTHVSRNVATSSKSNGSCNSTSDVPISETMSRGSYGSIWLGNYYVVRKGSRGGAKPKRLGIDDAWSTQKAQNWCSAKEK